MKKPNVYITRQIPEAGIAILKKHCSVSMNPHNRALTQKELIRQVKSRDGVLCQFYDRIDSEVMEAAVGIKGFANFAVGFNNIDIPQATQRKIPISNTPGVLTDATAEMAWALLFAVARKVTESDRSIRAGKWKGWAPMQFIGSDVAGKTLGIIGAGRIGAAMALKSKGFDMKILYHSPHKNLILEKRLGAKKATLDKLISESDFISLHCPLRADTRHLITEKEFRRMKKSAYLINTARGPVVKESDLVKALKKGWIAGAGIDVYENEPALAPGLAKLPNAVLTAHTGSATDATRHKMALKSAANLLAMVQGKRAPDCVNPEIYE